MRWLLELFLSTDSVAHSVLIVTLVAAVGLAIGHVSVRGISVGIAGVLFAGLAFAHAGVTINHEVLEFLRDFGLILFVFTLGLQVGPGFFASLRRDGLPLNIAATFVVLGGVAVAAGQYLLFMPRDALPAAVGLLSGATTNTPSLAAAQTTFADRERPTSTSVPAPQPASAPTASQPVHGDEQKTVPPVTRTSATIGSAYAIAYPFGICGTLLTMVLIRAAFRIDVADERRKLAADDARQHPSLDVVNVEVVNSGLEGRQVEEIPTLGDSGVVITRLLREGRVAVAKPEQVLKVGDVLTAVGPAAALRDLEMIVGRRAAVDVRAVRSDITAQAFLVSNANAAGRTVAELGFGVDGNVRVTRIRRSGLELPVTPLARLQIGDRIMTVGDRDSMASVARTVGDDVTALDKPMLVPILLGIALGVVVGSIPISLGAPVPVRLGLAGGPLVIALLLSRLHRVGPLVWYMPNSANFTLRELGISLFLACAGLRSGGSFAATLGAHGVQWLLLGAAITFIPIMAVAIVARGVFKMNYVTLCGLLAGSMTDPPALSFANQITKSDAPTVSYATVYPLVMLLRVLTAQALVMAFT